MFHLEQVWRDGEWETYEEPDKMIRKHMGTCESHSEVGLNCAEVPGSCRMHSGVVGTHRNCGRHGKLSEAVRSCRKCWKLRNMWLVTGETSGSFC